MKCICERAMLKPNASIDTPWFPGIVRFPTEVVTDFHQDCPSHGYMFTVNIAALLRYGD